MFHCQNSSISKEWLILNLLCKLLNILLANRTQNVVLTCQREYIYLDYFIRENFFLSVK